MASSQTTVQILMPAMGESVTEGVVLEWRKQVGERVAVDEAIVEISTDKVDAEVPSPAAGVLCSINVEPDQTVEVGQLLGEIETDASAQAAPDAEAPDPDAEAGAVNRSAAASNGETTSETAGERPAAEEGNRATAGGDSAPAGAGNGDANATPVAARMAAGHGIDLASISPTGPRGRVTKQDVEAAIDGGAATPGAAAAPAPANGSSRPIRGPAATLVRFMDASRSIPTATSFRTLTVDVLAERRAALKAAGRRLSFTHLIAWAIVTAARELPVMADAFEEVEGRPHRVTPGSISLGIAVDVERKGARSLVVPVLRDASS